MQSVHLRVGLVLLVIGQASCGGGGGGGDGGGSSRQPSVAANSTSITLTKTVAEATSPVVVRVTASNVTGNIYAGLEFSGGAIAFADWEGQSDTTAEITVSFPVPGDLAPGVLTGSIRFEACLDETCTRHLQGSPIVIPVRLTVIGIAPIDVTVSPDRFDVSARKGAGASSGPRETATLTFASAVTGAPWVSVNHAQTIIYDAWSTVVSTTSIEATIELWNPDLTGVGTFSDTVTITVCYTPSCANSVIAAPVTIPLSYTVQLPGPRSEPDVDPLVPLLISGLEHDVIDAEYSKALDAIVMVASYPTNALYLLDVDLRTEQQVSLNKPPTSVSVSPDGLHAAVGHDALITYVDLSQVGMPGAPAPVLLNVSAIVHDLVLDSRGYVHAFPRTDQWVNVHSVEIATNVETLGSGQIYSKEHARLHPSGEYIYGADNGLSPSDIEKFDITSVPTTLLYDSPYHGDYAMCGDLWFDETGASIYTACGNVFRASAVAANDMVYAGALAIAPTPYYGFEIRSLSETDALKEIAEVEDDVYFCRVSFDPSRCYSHLSLYASDFLNRTARYSFQPMTVGGGDYAQIGLFVFHSADGTRKFALSRLGEIPNPDAEYYFSEL